MRLLFLTVLVFSGVTSSLGQSIPDGLWNAGGIIVPAVKENTAGTSPRIDRPLIHIDLYPGVSVVKSRFTLSNPGNTAMTCTLELKDTGTYTQSTTSTVFIRRPALVKAFINDSLLPSDNPSSEGIHKWDISIPASSSSQLTIYQLTENYQSKLVKEGNNREANAMAVINNQISTPCEVLVRLQEPLTLTNILGISPAKKTVGDVHHLQYTLKDEPLLIWYEGLPGDFNFNKKILPQADTLFATIDQFPESEFNQASFAVIDRYNFSTNPKNPVATILYFMMFSAPWIILGGFIIFLLRKPKKKIIET